jgi:hypothetical protein
MVSPLAIRLYRVVLLAYPSRFRRGFGAEMVRLLIDRRRHEARSEWRILLEETVDAARAAPRMRWESPVNRIVILAVVGTAAIAAILVAHLALILLAVLGLAAWFAWLIAGGAAIAIAIAIPAIDGGELSELWWTVMMLTLLGGIGMAITGALLAVSGRAERLASPHSS